MTPMERYHLDLKKDGFSYDSAQEHAVQKLDDLYHRLIAAESAKPKGKLDSFKDRFRKRKPSPERGLYFWGGVGRGKTWLMDTFFDSLPFDRKMRVHFHRFMHRVHHELKGLEGVKDPLKTIARTFAAEARVICFDEFFVSDIGDAMILAGLLDELFANEVCLVCTSNIIPDGLYKDGLQRARFLPAIALVNEHTEVINVDGGVDYRLRTLEQAELYHFPLDSGANRSLEKSYEGLAVESGGHDLDLEINSRIIKAVRRSDDVVWFEFAELCDGPRSQNDYIELAKEFHAVLISNIPVMGGDTDDQARRFINLIDEFYDRNVKLVVSAEASIDKLYRGGKLDFEFERTQSRLLEMQSQEYLEAPHKP
ncbi:MAG: cell division protein ZapE [Gammaproteobacteria bacterium]|nr:MAG: cell division protein ZapE [Pseudomonadota bacterium]PIE38213.1 MAG: cell division protein ZapE [Gammaproteobacteria bacterium]